MPATSIEDAIEEIATGMVRSSSEEGRSVERLSLKELIEADRYIASKASAAKPHFGLRMTKLVPPSTG